MQEQDTIKILCENSILNNRWAIKQKPYEIIESIKSAHNLSYLCATVLANREIAIESIERFLSPSLKHTWTDPAILPDITRAIELLKHAIKNNQTIGIIGDYDVDGVSASVLWKDLLDILKIKTHVWLPNRSAGYGPSNATIEFFTQNTVDLIIMVDCGSSANEFVAECTRSMPKLEMIIIDHHIAKLDEEMKKKIVINPHRKDINQLELGDFLSLCATGISFFVAHQLLKKMQFETTRSQEILKQLLDLVACATVCDIMPMTPINRALIAQGLKILESQSRVGIKILMQKSQIKFPLTANDIGFYIGPRLNAAGRMQDPHIAFELLSTKSQERALELTAQLEKLNKERKIMQQYAFDDAVKMIEALDEIPDIICLAHENWHAGIVGIVAAMIQDKFNKPTIIGAIQGNIIKASARSKLLHIGNLIQKAALEEIILAGGGHQCAGGLSATKEQWENFTKWIVQQTHDHSPTPVAIMIDAVVDLEQIEDDYKKLAPHGPKHDEVVIVTHNTRVQNIFETDTYARFTILQNFKNHTFFLQKRRSKLIEPLKQAHAQRQTLSLLIKLSEKGFHNIEDCTDIAQTPSP